MKKTVIILLILMNIVTVDASGNEPKYKIIANSNSDEDIETMYEIKDSLIKDYQQWVKSVDDVDQALADHQKNYLSIVMKIILPKMISFLFPYL